jgi:ATP-dependent Clp protease ATP-binding subunit ClpB
VLGKLKHTVQGRFPSPKRAFQPTGARPLKRAIQKKIETPLGRLLLKGAVRDGQTLLVDAGSETGDLSFTPEAVAAV